MIADPALDVLVIDTVIWATGYTTDHTCIDIPGAKDEQGRIRHTRGVTPSLGLYVLGLTWQHTRGSALIGWVGEDAAILTEQIPALSEPEQRR
jgi:putative flavoprotein involved in K+ transport